MPLQYEHLGFVYAVKLSGEPLDEVARRDLGDTVSAVLRNYYGKVELISSSGLTVHFRVAGWDLFKAEKVFGGFMNQLGNQWDQGLVRRARARPDDIQMTSHSVEVPPGFVASGSPMPKYPPAPTPLEWKPGCVVNGRLLPVKPLSRAEIEQRDDADEPLPFPGPPRPVVKQRIQDVLASIRAEQRERDADDRCGVDPVHGPAVTVCDEDEDEDGEPAEPPLAPLSDEQKAAYDRILREPGHFFLTGKAGTGKSHLIKHLLKTGKCKATATTARAALIVGGTTVDRVFCFEREKWQIRGGDRLNDIMLGAPGIILIDEASMVGANMAGVLQKVAKQYRKKLVLVGDLAQASPVKDDWLVGAELFQEIVATNHFLKLTESHRQSERPLLDALDALRRGEVNAHVRDIFAPCIANDPDSVAETAIRLYATNAATDAYNNRRLQALETIGAPVNLVTVCQDLRRPDLRTKYPMGDAEIAKAIDAGSFAHGETFKIGARVLLTKNEGGDEGRYVNGDAGTIVDIIYTDQTSAKDAKPHNPFSSDSSEAGLPAVDAIVITLDRLGHDIRLLKTSQTMKDASDKDLYGLIGFPIRLGYAMSIHKSQGMTVDEAFLDMSTINHMRGESRHGLAYVALSRTRTLAGLHIANWSNDAVYCSPVIKPFV
jgi:ATP-dependent DNA helicase PIF1